MLAGSIVAISLIDSDKLSASLGAITVLFANLLGAMAIFNKISSDTGKVSKACTAMIAMSVAVSILAVALKKVSDLDWGELARGLVGIAGLTTIVVASSKAMASSQKQVMKGATSLIIFGAAIKILASACEDLSKLQWDELGRGLTGVGVLFAEIAVFLRVAKFNGKMISTATGIVILSAAMKVLASACKDFGQMEWSEIGKGLAGIGGLLAELAVFTNLAGNAKHVMSTGVALIAIGAAMKIFASAVKDFGQLQWDEIGRGLTAIGGALAEVAIAVNLMPKNMIGIGTGLVIVGGALETIANCMSKFGGMQWEEIGRGLTVMGGALAELAISLNFMKGTLGDQAALLVASELSCSCAGTQYFGSVIMGSDCERTYFYCRSIHNYRRSRRGTYTIGSDYSGIIGSVCIDWCWGSYNRSGFTCSLAADFGTCYRIHSAGNCWCRWSDCNRSSTDSYRYWYRWLNSGRSYKSRRRNYRNLQSYCCRSASYW